MNYIWVDSLRDLVGVTINESLSDWLLYRGSTTFRLREQYGLQLQVELLDSSAFPDALLSSATDDSYGRHVVLSLNKRPWMLATTFIPGSLIKLGKCDLSAKQPLGELLFSKKGAARKNVKFAVLALGSLRFMPGCEQLLSGVVRRSEIDFYGKVLFLFELFLPHDFLS